MILVRADRTVIEHNDYRDAALSGWTGEPNNGDCVGGPGAIFLLGNDNSVAKEEFPINSAADTQICDQGIGNVIQD